MLTLINYKDIIKKKPQAVPLRHYGKPVCVGKMDELHWGALTQHMGGMITMSIRSRARLRVEYERKKEYLLL